MHSYLAHEFRDLLSQRLLQAKHYTSNTLFWLHSQHLLQASEYIKGSFCCFQQTKIFPLTLIHLLLKESKTKQSCKVQSLQPILLVVYLSQSNCSIHSTTPDWLAGYTGMIKTCWLKYQVWLTCCRRDGNLGEGLGTRLAKQTSLSGESEGEIVGLAIRF